MAIWSLFTVPALARNFQCAQYRCTGTNQSDNILERACNTVADHIEALRGADTIKANLYGSDTDRSFGNRGPGTLYTDDGDGRDEAWGGPGFDRCYGTRVDVTVGCEVIR